MAVITPGNVSVAGTPGPGGTILGNTDDVIAGIYRELRIQTMLYTQMVTLLSQIVGPANAINGWTPLDVSNDLDNWRNDADTNLT